jgi:hypothetical protein
MNNPQNTVRRQILASSPIYVPFAANLGIMLIAGCFIIYNLADLPTISQVSKLTAS